MQIDAECNDAIGDCPKLWIVGEGKPETSRHSPATAAMVDEYAAWPEASS